MAVASDWVTLPGRREGHVGRDREGIAATATGAQLAEAEVGDRGGQFWMHVAMVRPYGI
jgi:hypothetical protein